MNPPTMMTTRRTALWLLFVWICAVSALINREPCRYTTHRHTTRLFWQSPTDENSHNDADLDSLPLSSSYSSRRRRDFFFLASFLFPSSSPTHAAVQRAVGGAEQQCQQEGNCLEMGEWDGAIGWQWGAKERCDSTDPLCGVDGKMRDQAALQGAPVPTSSTTTKITHRVSMKLAIGRNSEEGILRLGLFGNDCPVSVSQLVSFLSPEGLVTTQRLPFIEGYDAYSDPVSMVKGGALNRIYPNERLDFGVPSQAAASAKRRGKSKVGAGFIPQPRPKQTAVDDAFVRKHDAAGLLSMPGQGLGYGVALSSDDETFSSGFQITADAVPSMDREGRRVVGQVFDSDSMAFLARLASLPTSKGLKGIIPGQNSGPPLLRVTLQGVQVESVGGES